MILLREPLWPSVGLGWVLHATNIPGQGAQDWSRGGQGIGPKLTLLFGRFGENLRQLRSTCPRLRHCPDLTVSQPRFQPQPIRHVPTCASRLGRGRFLKPWDSTSVPRQDGGKSGHLSYPDSLDLQPGIVCSSCCGGHRI